MAETNGRIIYYQTENTVPGRAVFVEGDIRIVGRAVTVETDFRPPAGRLVTVETDFLPPMGRAVFVEWNPEAPGRAVFVETDFSAGAIDTPFTRDPDVRLFTSGGTRKNIPRDQITEIKFAYNERGGWESGSLRLARDYNPGALTGTEYIDIYLFGERAFRGWPRIISDDMGFPEAQNLNLFGFQHLLEGLLVSRNYCYSQSTPVETVFVSLVTESALRSDRYPSLLIDTTGVPDLHLTLREMHFTNRTLPSAINDLCDLFPGALIWGCDVNASGQNRVYLRPRSATPAYWFPVGDKITGFTYPRDASQIVNRIYIAGGMVNPANLIPNGSFEECAVPGDLTGNLLSNPSFETNDGNHIAPPWTRANDPTLTSDARTGSWAYYMDDNPAGPEQVTQIIPISGIRGLSATIWMQSVAGAVNTANFKIDLYDDAFNNYGTKFYGAFTPTADGYWHQYRLDYIADYPTGSIGFITQAAVTIIASSIPDDTKGIHLDDIALFTTDSVTKSWRQGASVNAVWTQLDWNNGTETPTPFHGGNKVKGQPNILVTGGYTEITTTEESRISVKKNTPYNLQFGVNPNTTSSSASCGVRLFNGTTLETTLESAAFTLVNSLWQSVNFSFTTGPNTTHAEPFLRLKTDDVIYYIDAAGFYEGSLPTNYYPAEQFSAFARASDYSAVDIGAEAVASEVTWGHREREVSNASVVDAETKDAFAIGYLRANAVPSIQATLEISDAQRLVKLDGQVKILNLSGAPSPLFPARIRYTVDNAVKIDLELNNERDSMGTLLRLLQSRGI